MDTLIRPNEPKIKDAILVGLGQGHKSKAEPGNSAPVDN
jgi:hypothetical protein